MLGSLLPLVVLASSWASPYPEVVGPPESMSALGDSITRAANTSVEQAGERPALSWSTGASETTDSHYRRLVALGATVTAHNDAVSGARMEGIGTQVTNAIARSPQYVTVLMGANDACRSHSDRTPNMTDPAVFRAHFEAAMEALTTSLPEARIFVASVPDLYVLWEVLHTNEEAVQAWDAFRTCQSLLFNPQSTDPADVERRETVRARVAEYNVILEEVCARHLRCRFDQNTVFNEKFTAADVSSADYFHPSLAGQIRLATETWPVTFDFTDAIAPVTTATVAPSTGGAVVTLSATDAAGVRGIEYRFGGDDAWSVYEAPLTVSSDRFIFFRAVDLNGNTERAQRYPLEESDGGLQDADGGGDAGSPPAGCGCASGGAAPLVTCALVLWGMASRRRSPLPPR